MRFFLGAIILLENKITVGENFIANYVAIQTLIFPILRQLFLSQKLEEQ